MTKANAVYVNKVVDDLVGAYALAKNAGVHLNDCHDKLMMEIDAGNIAVGEVVELAGGRKIRVIDNFAKGNSIWRSLAVHRFDFQEIK